MRVLVSELAGRASVELKARELDIEVDREVVGRVIERVKQMEAEGYSFEAAEASFELMLREEVDGKRWRPFVLESYRVITDSREDAGGTSEASVKLHVGEERIVETGEGNGPVNALDMALRKALERFYPQLGKLELVDYKVRILEGVHGTGAVTRVLVRTSDGEREWDTVGVDENVIAASWQALDDAYTFGLLRSTSS
jgi:2-isopropylmalate synthase